MKKSIISPLGNSRKAYEKPSIEIYHLKMQHALLTASEEKLNIIDDEEEKWPVDPDTGQPLAPW